MKKILFHPLALFVCLHETIMAKQPRRWLSYFSILFVSESCNSSITVTLQCCQCMKEHPYLFKMLFFFFKRLRNLKKKSDQWTIKNKRVFWIVLKDNALLKHSYLSLYFVCQLYYWSYSLKQRFLCAILFQQSHITKHTSVSSPRKTLITTTLSTKCLSYCNISKPSHMCMPKWRPVFFREHFNFCRDHNCTMYKKNSRTLYSRTHWFLS